MVELTGRFNASLPEPTARYDDVRIGLAVPREVLAVRVEQRVLAMFEEGWVDEVRTLVRQGLLETRTAVKAIGYREVAAVAAGELSVDGCCVPVAGC